MGILIFKDIFNILLGCLISVKVNLGSVDPVLIEDRTIPLKCEAEAEMTNLCSSQTPFLRDIFWVITCSWAPKRHFCLSMRKIYCICCVV